MLNVAIGFPWNQARDERDRPRSTGVTGDPPGQFGAIGDLGKQKAANLQ